MFFLLLYMHLYVRDNTLLCFKAVVPNPRTADWYWSMDQLVSAAQETIDYFYLIKYLILNNLS